MDRLSRQLNDETPDVIGCAWPNCDDRLIRGGVRPSDGLKIPGLRVGILCMKHARKVAEAVFEDDVWATRFRQAFSQRQEPVDMRGAEKARREKARQQEIERRRGDSLGFVYYLEVGERIKIGFSTDVKRRMRQYPPGSRLLAIEPGDYDLELRRHRQFMGSRTEGREWFRPTPDLMEHIALMVTEHGDPKRYAHHFRKNENPVRVRRSA